MLSVPGHASATAIPKHSWILAEGCQEGLWRLHFGSVQLGCREPRASFQSRHAAHRRRNWRGAQFETAPIRNSSLVDGSENRRVASPSPTDCTPWDANAAPRASSLPDSSFHASRSLRLAVQGFGQVEGSGCKVSDFGSAKTLN